MDFNSQYERYLKIIEDKIEQYFRIPTIPQKSVFEAMKYAICGGGKRIRPVLLMSVGEMLGADLDDCATVGLAIECIHNYSLIHDDLPCMDNDDIRRGRATCHRKFGESTALLAGDGLLNMAFEILSDSDNFRQLSGKSLLSIIKRLSAASGVYGMIGGQVVDLENENRSDVRIDELEYMHKGKTGAIISAAAVCGALCAGLCQEDETVGMLEGYASELGLAFQIKDDILDVVGDEALLGKPIGSDEQSGKTTFVTLLGLDGARRVLEEKTNEAKRAISPLGESGWFLNSLADFLLKRSF